MTSRLKLHVHKLKSHKDELNFACVLVTFDLGNEDNLQKLAHTRGAEHTHPGAEAQEEYLVEEENDDKTTCRFTSEVTQLISNNLCATKQLLPPFHLPTLLRDFPLDPMLRGKTQGKGILGKVVQPNSWHIPGIPVLRCAQGKVVQCGRQEVGLFWQLSVGS